MNSVVNWKDVISRGAKIAGTGYGQQLVGRIAQPLFTDIKEQEQKKLELDEDSSLQELQTPLQKFWSEIKDGFALGDALTCIGLGLLTLSSFFFNRDEDRAPGFLEKVFRSISLVMTFGGSSTAFLGRTMDWHRSVALGDDYAEALLDSAERSGKKIFVRYSDAKKKELIEEAQKLDRVLVYKKGVSESVHERHERDDIGGLLDGPPGTGKTDGVKCIIGKWVKRLEKEGDEAVVAELNLANFDDYIKELNQQQNKALEALQAGADIQVGSENSFASNQGLMVLEVLVKRIQRLVKAVDRHNLSSPNSKQKLVVFVDEFDKVFDPNTLKGCDKSRLKNLLIQFNDLFVKQNLLLTSNLSLEEIIKSLKQHLYVDEDHTGKEVWEPIQDRLASKNRTYVDLPGPVEQADIVSARLLDDYRDFIDWSDFGLNNSSQENFDFLKHQLGEAISDMVTSKINKKMSGRQLRYACDDILGLLLGKAKTMRLQSPVYNSDDEWNNLSAEEKLTKTGAKVDRELLNQALSYKLGSVRKDTSESDKDLAFDIVAEFLEHKDVKRKFVSKKLILNPEKLNLDKILDRAYTHKRSKTRDLYICPRAIEFNGKLYRHMIYKFKREVDGIQEDPEYSVAFAELNSENETLGLHNMISTSRVSADEFRAQLSPSIKKLGHNPLSKFVNTIFNAATGSKNEAELAKALISSVHDLEQAA